MKRFESTLSILWMIGILLISACGSEKQQTAHSELSSDEGLYFGQETPGSIPADLIPEDFYSEGWKLGAAFTPRMDEFYFTNPESSPFSPAVVVFRKENRRWVQYDFNDTGNDTLYSKDKFIERTNAGWSAIKSLGAPFDTIPIMRLTASSKGTLAFDEFTRDGNGVLRYSRLINGKREAPKPLSAAINTGKWNAHPFIALDESYIIWDGEREDGYGDGDMYISFQQDDGTWGAAINFGAQINTDGEDGGGYVTPDGKYLTFCPRCFPPFDRKWVDAKIIETLRSQNNQ